MLSFVNEPVLRGEDARAIERIVYRGEIGDFARVGVHNVFMPCRPLR